MQNFARLPEEERKTYFIETANLIKIRPALVEKDFWVCWTLQKLFGLPGIGNHLTFKGGTSLSKAYRIIQRFSEDIDITISRDYLGFGGNHDPENAPSKKQRRAWLEKLREACRDFVSTKLQIELAREIATALAEGTFDLSMDMQDPDGQTLRFRYPSCWPDEEGAYFGKFVKIEMGARSDTWPNKELNVIPYVAEHYPKKFQAVDYPIQVLSKERTFWEKAALLHEENCRPTDKPIKPRMSRHYSDLSTMVETGDSELALAHRSLFERVVEHRSVFFAYTWVDYAQMKTGPLRLSPRADRVAEWKADYERTQEMFFQQPPAFEKVLENVAAFEKRFKG